MPRLFVELPSFWRDWVGYGLTDEDLRKMQNDLETNPNTGKLVIGTGGVRKLRYAREHRGKSGGVRVIYRYLRRLPSIREVDFSCSILQERER